MEWALNVDLFKGTTTIFDGAEESVVADFAQLHDRGLPQPFGDRHTIRVRLGEGHAVEEIGGDIAQKLSIPFQLWNTHSIYIWMVNGRKYLIPALALIRAFYGPSRFLLAEMFRPQALERICYLNFDNIPPTLCLVGRGMRPKGARAQEACNLRLHWMLAYPSAHQMAGSIHRFGLQGRLDISMPKAVAYLEVAGVPIDDFFLVTRCRIMSLAPEEEPIAGVPATARFAIQKFRGYGSDVTRHVDGSVTLNDEEWRRICDLTGIGETLQASPLSRPLLDAILQKLADETAWENITCSVGSIETARKLHQTLVKRGHFEKILRFLDSIRVLSATPLMT